jgi:hypothetical protein
MKYIIYMVSHLFTRLFMNEYQIGIGTIIEYINIVTREYEAFLQSYFPHLFYKIKNLENFQDFECLSREQFTSFHEQVSNILNILFPDYGEIEERIEKSNNFIMLLKKCSPGKKDWAKYEELCIGILTFLFLPPFKNILSQVRTESGDTRRDAVLPNNNYEGFWSLIRNEFNSQHIICEFKNYRDDIAPNQLNQLRIYLSKKRVGKFGLLFVRKKPTSKLLNAQKRAYEESGILILIIDDDTLEKMLKMRAYTGQADEMLQSLKIQFELNSINILNF